jgi:succinate dehydrogenase / fumarate reductase cytochrome b subunit
MIISIKYKTCKKPNVFLGFGHNFYHKFFEKMTIKKSSTASSRPTSPHLQIYKWNISSFTSILHRLTGIVLYASIVVISWYIVYYAYQINVSESMETCDCPMNAIFDKIFSLAAIAVTFCLYYHFNNGIRHLFWDLGKGFEKETAKTNGFLVIALSLIFTAITIGFSLYLKIF